MKLLRVQELDAVRLLAWVVDLEAEIPYEHFKTSDNLADAIVLNLR